MMEKTPGCSEALYYTCESCRLRFPSLESLKRCPACGGGLRFFLSRPLEKDGPKERKLLEPSCVGVLENLRSAWNVGSIFRTAEAAGLSHLYLCGITPAGDHPAVAKTALGAEEVLPWSHHPNALELTRRLQKEGFFLLALETEGSRPWHPGLELPEQPLALVVGNELCGVDPEVLSLCDLVLQLPMRGYKRSLNVAVAFGVLALWLSARRSIPR
ncbi:RNA methyltransferase [Thermosulfurimonas marina]|uniref:RNA methyltransferase n=1 Tax=Thermosulfurimonas marina TaxID=2047767 RepID=A0A6H1WQM0_9BACT|nr:RNA methyltransferase [Thermosulfurimonas marina]QJA05458.1 RNA methyltransferase [Thermosulfurimonas marina]